MAGFNPFSLLAGGLTQRLQASPFAGLLGIGQNDAGIGSAPASPPPVAQQPAPTVVGATPGSQNFQMTELPADRASLPKQLYQYGLQLGFNPAQTSAILGNIKQESEFNPKALNPGEGANGMIQWRLDRFNNLRKYAAEMGKSWQDPFVQMSYIKHEMDTTEAGNSATFKRAQDIDTANAGLKQYIRYGDNSQGTRRNNAAAYYKQFAGLDAGPAVDLKNVAQNASPLDRVLAASNGGANVPFVGLSRPTGGASAGQQGQQTQKQSVLDRALSAARGSPTNLQMGMSGGQQQQPQQEAVDTGAQEVAALSQSLNQRKLTPSQKAAQRKQSIMQRRAGRQKQA